MRSGVEPQQRVIARVGEKTLYAEQVASLFTAGMPAGDSMKLLESYVDLWIKKELKLIEAENLFSDRSADIEKMVEDYRSSLLTHKLEQYYVDTRPDSADRDQAVEEYYAAHRADFTLDRPLAKGVIVKLPQSFRQLAQVKTSMASTRAEKYQDFLDIIAKNGFDIYDFTQWTDFGEFLTILPVSRQADNDKILTNKQVSEFKEGEDVYLLLIREYLQAGDAAPIERVNEIIRRMLSNRRKQEIVRGFEDSLYNAALQRGQAKVMIYEQ